MDVTQRFVGTVGGMPALRIVKTLIDLEISSLFVIRFFQEISHKITPHHYSTIAL